METIIEIKNLSKSFGNTLAVNHLSLEVKQGSIYAFLGPNGAGKTTTIKMLMNIIQADEGEANIIGKSSRELGASEFAQIGYVSENQKMPDWMTIPQLINYFKPFYPGWDDDFCARLLEQFDLPIDKKIKNMSRGMQMKAALLTSLAYRPKLLVLDEPFSGLDPLVRDEFIRGVLELTQQENWTVFISSHDIDEVERLADWVGIINKGNLKYSDKISTMQENFRSVEVITEGESKSLSSLPENWLNPEASGHTIKFVDNEYSAEKLKADLNANIPDFKDFNANPMSLRDIFLALAKTYRLSE